MRIINKTKNTILAQNTVVAETALSRVKGLLGRSDLKEGEALILKPCSSMHTLFMSFSIDVIFVDSKKKVVKTISTMAPFRLSSVYFNAHLAIELPAGTISKTHTHIGDLLEF